MREPDERDRDPFERLLQTHRRIEERLDELLKACAALGGHGDADEVVRDVAGFFSRAGRKHVDDEEQTLFPRLQAHPELAVILKALADEHVTHDRLEGELQSLADAPGALDAARVSAVARSLADTYRAHIAREENELFPAARAALSSEVLLEMAREMSNRRGDRGRGGRAPRGGRLR